MKTIKADIRSGEFRRVYLIFGTEVYLKKLYRDKLKNALVSENDEMNFSHYEGKAVDETEVINMAQTLPFFAERRMLLIEGSGWFKSQGKLADEISALPDTTVLVFVEDEIDKRNRLYKAVREAGYVCEINGMEERDLKLWTVSLLRAAGKNITDATMNYFLGRVGTDMGNIQTEVEKLIGFAWERDVITIEDVDAICTEQVTGKIFQMIDDVAAHNAKRALALYHDLLVLREKPMSVLFLMIRQFNLLLQMKELGAEGMTNAAIAKAVGVPPFAVSKYLSQARAFTSEALLQAVQNGVMTEERVKTGQMNEQLAVELFLVQYALTV